MVMRIEFTKKVILEMVDDDNRNSYTQMFDVGDVEDGRVISEYGKYADIEFASGEQSLAVNKNCFTTRW